MPYLDTLAEPTASENAGGAQPEIRCLDCDTASLFAEVEAILRAASPSAHQPPARPVTGCALMRPRSASRSYGATVRPRLAPARHVRALQRGPPTPPRDQHQQLR